MDFTPNISLPSIVPESQSDSSAAETDVEESAPAKQPLPMPPTLRRRSSPRLHSPTTSSPRLTRRNSRTSTASTLTRESAPARPAAPTGSRNTKLSSSGAGYLLWILALIVLVVGGLRYWESGSETVASIQHVVESSGKEIVGVDSMLAKSMKSKLDLIDMRIGQELAALKRDVEHMIQTEVYSIASNVHSLKSRIDNLESSISILKESGTLTRQEAVELLNKAAEERALVGTGKATGFDDVRVAVRKVVDDEFERHRADGIGRTDYALASGGGRVIDYSEGYFHLLPRSGPLDWLPERYRRHPKAGKINEPSFGEPGQCLPLKGSKVYVDIRLREPIYPDAVTIHHVSKTIAYDLGSAPKDFQILGWLAKGTSGSNDKILLGEFTYDINKSTVQTFELSLVVRKSLVNTIRFQVLSNYGSPTHTCLYRLRVHGWTSDKASLKG